MKTGVAVWIAAVVVALAPAARAQDLGTVKARMRARLAKIAELKQAGQVGETRAGYLGVVRADAAPAVHKFVQAENHDRRLVYERIAKATGRPAADVARQRARQLFDKAAPGVMLQDEDGQWRARE